MEQKLIFTLKQQARTVILLQKNFQQNCNMTIYACIFLAKFFKRKKKCGAHGFTSNQNLRNEKKKMSHMACHVTQLVLPLKKKQIEVFDKKDSTQLNSSQDTF